MSQQTLPTPPPELPRVGSFFPYKCLVFTRNVLKGKLEYFGVIQDKMSDLSFKRSRQHKNSAKLID